MSADGNWNVTLDTPMGAQAAALELKTDGDSLSGTMNSPQGSMEFSGGTVNGNELAWNLEMTQPMAMTLEVTATVDGDNLTGQVKLGSFGTAQLKGTRA
jgi:hypothetical protein